MCACVCVCGGRGKDTIPHCDKDKRLREQRCMCERCCVEQHALVGILAQLTCLFSDTCLKIEAKG